MRQKKTKKTGASKSQEWWIERNKRRRNKYAQDREYRAKVNQNNRDNYRAKTNFYQNMAISPEQISSLGTKRNIDDGRKLITFNVDQISLILGGYHKIVVYRWINNGKFPEPPHKSVDAPYEKVFTLHEAKKLARIFLKHQKYNAYLRSDHTETINELLSVV